MAMRKFLKNIAWFSLIIALLLGVGELVVRNMKTSYTYKDAWLRAHGQGVNTLVLGSSHLYFGVMPQLLGDSAFNLANISQTPEYDFGLLKHYGPNLPNLKRVIIPISYFTYVDPELETIDPRLAIQYQVGMNLGLHSKLSRYNFCLSDFQSYAQRLRSIVINVDINNCDSLGFGLGYDIETRAKNWRSATKSRVEDVTRSTPGRAREVNATLRQLIAWCRKRNIRVYFVTTPVIAEFRQLMDKGQHAEMLDITRKICADTGTPWLYLMDDETFEDADFHDSDHLTPTGAHKLTLRLKEFIEQV